MSELSRFFFNVLDICLALNTDQAKKKKEKKTLLCHNLGKDKPKS